MTKNSGTVTTDSAVGELHTKLGPPSESCSSEHERSSESLEAKVGWTFESAPESTSETEDGETLEEIEYDNRSKDSSDSAASLENFLDDADAKDAAQSTMFYAAFNNLRDEQGPVSVFSSLLKDIG